MKRPQLSTDLVPLDRFQEDLATWLDRPASTGRPVVLTRDGRAAAAVISPEMLDQLEEERLVVREICLALQEVAAGDVVENDEVWADVEAVLEAAAPETLAS